MGIHSKNGEILLTTPSFQTIHLKPTRHDLNVPNKPQSYDCLTKWAKLCSVYVPLEYNRVFSARRGICSYFVLGNCNPAHGQP